MIPKPLRPFVTRLKNETDNRTLSWLPSGSGRAFSCAHKNYNLHIWSGTDSVTETGFVSFKMDGPSSILFSTDHGENDYEIMSDLLSSIEANAANFDEEAINDFFS